jgi:hypothetical protein
MVPFGPKHVAILSVIYLRKNLCIFLLIVCGKMLYDVWHTPVFKKRPNFLNSSPTSTESALRLLNAPSGRFWQQTAICPVLLWALDIELHPLNWSRAQAVRRINPTNGPKAVCCQNLQLGALSSHSVPSMLVGELCKKFGLFLNTPCISSMMFVGYSWLEGWDRACWIFGLFFLTS